MQDSKLMNVPIPVGVKLFVEHCPKAQEEDKDMSRVPYASAMGSLMYAMVYNRPDIAHAVGVLSRFMSNLGKEHWKTAKWVFKYLQALVIMACATREDQDWKECWTFMVLLMRTGLEIWTKEDLQVRMCLAYLEAQSIG